MAWILRFLELFEDSLAREAKGLELSCAGSGFRRQSGPGLSQLLMSF